MVTGFTKGGVIPVGGTGPGTAHVLGVGSTPLKLLAGQAEPNA